MKKIFNDEGIDLTDLERSEYDDAPGEKFFKCPVCGNEYLADFITEYNGRTMCIDCWSKKSGNN